MALGSSGTREQPCDMHDTCAARNGRHEAAHLPESPLLYRRRTVPQEVAPFRVGGGCPGVFGPYPSAGLDEWREF